MTLPLLQDAALFDEDFGEPVIYKPASGGSRAITATVFREAVAAAPGGGPAMLPVLHVEVQNSATHGISAAELNTGGDKLSVPLRPGGTAVDRRITQILTQDAGRMMLEVR